MIHTLFVSATTEPEALQKEFRKKLMTGGAIIRLEKGLSDDDLKLIAERFSPLVQPYNLAALVLEEVTRALGKLD